MLLWYRMGFTAFLKKRGGGNKKVLQNVARFIENKDICSYKTKANLQKTKKTTRYGYNEETI